MPLHFSSTLSFSLSQNYFVHFNDYSHLPRTRTLLHYTRMRIKLLRYISFRSGYLLYFSYIYVPTKRYWKIIVCREYLYAEAGGREGIWSGFWRYRRPFAPNCHFKGLCDRLCFLLSIIEFSFWSNKNCCLWMWVLRRLRNAGIVYVGGYNVGACL